MPSESSSGFLPRYFLGARAAWLWVVVAFLVRLAYLAEQGTESPLFYQPLLDELEAVESARGLLRGKGLGEGPLFKAPGYTIVLAAVMAIFGEAWPWGVRLLQHTLGALLAGIAADTARRLVPAGRARAVAGTVAGAAVAFYGPLVRLESCVCLDFLVAFLQSAMVWTLIRWGAALAPRRRRWLVAAAVLAAAAWLTRPTITLALPMLALWVGFRAVRFNNGRGPAIRPLAARTALASILLFLAPTLVAMLLIYARNAAAGEAMLMPWQGGYNLYHANRAGATGRYLTQENFVGSAGANPTQALATEGWRQAVARGQASPPSGREAYGAINAYWFGLARQEISENPARWLGLMGRKLIYLVSDKEIFNYEEYDLHRTLSSILPWLPGRFGIFWPLALASLALVGQVPRVRRPEWALLWLYFLFLGFAIALYYTSGRMRMPLVFPVIVAAAGGLGLLAQRPRPGAGLLAGYGVLVVAGAVMSWGDWWGVRSERMWHSDLGRLSNAAWRDGRPQRAFEFAERAEAERPGYPTIPLLKGQALYALGRHQEAAQAFRKSMTLLPTDSVAPYNLGVILYYHESKPREAAEAFAEALKRNRDYHQAAWRGALAAVRLGDPQAARELLAPYQETLAAAQSGRGSSPPQLLLIAGVVTACASGEPEEAKQLAALLSEPGRKELQEELATAGLADCTQ